MFLPLDLLSFFHMLRVGFPQSAPQHEDPLPLLHHLPSPLSLLWLSSYYSSYIGRVLHCAFIQLLTLSS
jgi:hypothetical protein